MFLELVFPSFPYYFKYKILNIELKYLDVFKLTLISNKLIKGLLEFICNAPRLEDDCLSDLTTGM